MKRRRFSLTIQEIIERDELRNVYERNNAVAAVKEYIKELYHLPESIIGDTEAEQILAKMRLQILRKKQEQQDLIEQGGDYDDDELSSAGAEESLVFLAAAALPEERKRIDLLLEKYPDRIESKGAMLLNALHQIWGASPRKKS